MNADDELDDIWTIVPGAKRVAPASEPSLRVEQIKGVRPLDSQFGIDQPKTAPDALVELLFGQPYPKEAEIVTAVGDPDQLPHLETYAILDAAKVVNLPEMLETSDLEHRCLFKGAAYAEMKDVAPWIVRLEDGNTFTRNLFTRSDAPWHLWDVNAGIYLRSSETLDVVRAHFRKFTRVRDSTGKWYYFRFWEAPYLEGLLENGHAETIRRLLGAGDLLTCDPHQGRLRVVYRSTAPHPAVAEAFYLRRPDVAALRTVALRQFAGRLTKWLESSYGADEAADTFEFSLLGVRHARDVINLADERSVADYVAASWLLGHPAETRYDLTAGPDLAERLQLAHRDAAAARGASLKVGE